LNQALLILKKYWGYDSFLENQDQIIASILQKKDTIALIPTGGGKSMCFQIPAIISEGTCVVISPLIALINDQVNRLKTLNIEAEGLHSGIEYQNQLKILDKLKSGNLKLLYISPEKLQSDKFRNTLHNTKISFIAVDEAHCISQWGYDFRPQYRKIHNIKNIFPNIKIAAFTATANKRTLSDIKKYLKLKSPKLIRGSFIKPKITFSAVETEKKFKTLLLLLNEFNGSGIIYMRSRNGTVKLSKLINKSNIKAEYYHAGMSNSDRSLVQSNWLYNKTRVIVSTTAFGMGIDKPDVRFVIHYDLPGSMEEYYQEAGRAGRDRNSATSVIIYNKNDITSLIKTNITTFPTALEIQQTYNNLKAFLKISSIPENGCSYNIDIDKFYSFNSLQKFKTYRCINELERNGYINLNIPIKDIKSKLRLNFKSNFLNKLEEQDIQSYRILKAMIFNYENIFSTQVKISENEISNLLNIDSSIIKNTLKKLHTQNIVSYISQEIKFSISFNNSYTSLNKSELNFRFKKTKSNIKSIINYLEEKKCRQKYIVNYFDEKLMRKCGICDNCLYLNNLDFSKKELHNFTSLIESYQFNNTTEISDLLNIDTYLNRYKNLEMLKVLMKNNKIKIVGDKIIKIKSNEN